MYKQPSVQLKLQTYRLRSYWTFCVRSTFSMTKSWRWHRLKGWLWDLAMPLFHFRIPHIAYWEIFGVFSMCCSTVFRDMLVESPSDVSLKHTKEECLISPPNRLSSTAKLANLRVSTGCLVFGGCSRAHRSRPSWRWKATRLASWHSAPPAGFSPAPGYGRTALWSWNVQHL